MRVSFLTGYGSRMRSRSMGLFFMVRILRASSYVDCEGGRPTSAARRYLYRRQHSGVLSYPLSAHLIASHNENCSSLLGAAYLYSLNRCCLRFFFNFSFSFSRACIALVPALFHRNWFVGKGANNLGIVAVAGLIIDDKFNLDNEATH